MPEIMTLSNVTALRFASRTASLLRNLTFLYDANWSPDGGSSLPFAFFHVTKQEEVIRNEVSHKRVLLHSFGNVHEYSPTGALSVISDNVVPQPKVWRLSVLVPMDALMPFLEEASERTETGLRFASTALHDSLGAGMSDTLKTAADGMAVIRLILKLFSVTPSIVNYITQDLVKADVADYNRDSLEKMCHNRSILRMKEWSGWTYKYGVITSCTLTKEPLEENYYKGTIEFQEMPILTTNDVSVTVPAAPGFVQYAYALAKPVIEGVLLK